MTCLRLGTRRTFDVDCDLAPGSASAPSAASCATPVLPGGRRQTSHQLAPPHDVPPPPTARDEICTGKPANTFGFDGECQDAAYAAKIIDETHGFWKKMVRTRRASVGGMAARPPPAGPPSHLIAHLVADRDLLTGRAPAVAP